MGKGKKKKARQKKDKKARLSVVEAAPCAAPAVAADVAEGQALLTIPQLCRYLSISRATLYRLDLPGRLKVGNQVRFHKPTIDQWIVGQMIH